MSGFDTRWEAIAKANPALSDDESKVTLTIGELKRFLRKFYNAGEETVAPIADGLVSVLENFETLAKRNSRC